MINKIYNITEDRKTIGLVLLVFLLGSFQLFAQDPWELAPGAGNPAGNGQVTSTTLFFQEDVGNNNNFQPLQEPVSVSLEFTNPQYTGIYSGPNGQVGSFGWRNIQGGQGEVVPVFNQINSVTNYDNRPGIVQNNWFTTWHPSYGTSEIGTGIDVEKNYGAYIFLGSYGLAYPIPQPTNGRYYMVDLEITFSEALDNPIIHFSDLGGNTGSGNGMSTEFDLKDFTAASSLISFSQISSNGNLEVQSNSIGNNSNDIFNNIAYGSVKVNGEGITKIVLRVFLRGDGRGDSWQNDNMLKSGDELVISFSAGEYAPSEMEITKETDVENYKPGDIIDYTVRVTNPDAYPHKDVVITDNLPEGLTFVPGSTQVSIGNDYFPPFSVSRKYTYGPGTFTVPEGVTEITVETWGAGGAGGKFNRVSSGNSSGGGGGGAYSKSTVSVTSGQIYYYSVGAGGTSSDTNLIHGEDSWFSTTNSSGGAIVLAKGGNTGAANSSSGATGGQASSGIGDVKYSGGNGADGLGTGGGSNRYGGGGGASAGYDANGGNASAEIGGLAPAGGGNGADGPKQSLAIDGNPGYHPGGGGSGARRGNIGGQGANGQIIISYSGQISTHGDLGDAPNLASGWSILPGDELVITYQAKVDENNPPESLTNTASVMTNMLEESLEDEVIITLEKSTLLVTNPMIYQKVKKLN